MLILTWMTHKLVMSILSIKTSISSACMFCNFNLIELFITLTQIWPVSIIFKQSYYWSSDFWTMRTIKDYCQNTTIHGFAYLTSNRSLTEKYFELSKLGWQKVNLKSFFRAFWIITLIVSIFFTTTSIVNLILKVQNMPIIISLSDEELPVSDVIETFGDL